MNCDEEEIVLLATSIAMQLASGLDLDDLEKLRNLINQISCSLNTLIANRCLQLKKKNNKKDK